MALTNIKNDENKAIDTIWASDGTSRIKLGIGLKVADGNNAGWQGVASHTDGETFDASDGVVVTGGVQASGSTVTRYLVDSAGRQIVSSVPAAGTMTDRSGSITVGGTAQSMMAANLARKFLFIQNPHATEDIWINFTTTPAVADSPSIKIPAGGSFQMSGSFVSTEAISVLAATTGHKWTAKEG